MLPLRLRIGLSFSLLLLCTAVLVLLLGDRLVQSQVSRSAHSAAQRTLHALEGSIKAKQKLLGQGITFLADRPGTRDLGQTDSATITDHLSGIRPTVGADWLAFCDETGAVVGMSSPLVPRGWRPGDALGMPGVLNGKPWEGAFVMDGHVYLAAVRPIVVGPYVKGALIGANEIDDKFAQDIAAIGSAAVAIVYNDKVIASTFPASNVKREGGLLSATIDSKELVGSSAQIESLQMEKPLGLQALIPRDLITKPFEAIWKGTIFAFVSAFVTTLLIGSSLSRAITRPIEKLVEAARVLQSGGWPAKFSSSKKDELGFLLTAFDQMTAGLQANQERLLKLLDVDPLTQIWNHRSFKDKLESGILRAIEVSSPLSLLLINLDEFDIFNRGHERTEADQVLKQVADILLEVAGEEAACSRDNGDEFMVLLRADDAEAIAEQIREQIARDTPVTASIGIAMLDKDCARSDLLILAAQLAKDTAKQAGRNRVRTFEGYAAGDLEELRRFLQGGSYAAIRALAEAVDAKDEYTRGHSTRVAEYAKGIAETMRLDPGFIELLYVTGTLHDVGKIGVPDSTLKKPGKLSVEEFEEIKRHPILGEKIVSQLPMLKDALPGIRHHHERWDGKGYPDGIAGEDIPLLARILAVADAYDAMTSDRPYRRGMPQDVALKIMRENLGTQLDPALLSPFEEWLFAIDLERAA